MSDREGWWPEPSGEEPDSDSDSAADRERAAPEESEGAGTAGEGELGSERREPPMGLESRDRPRSPSRYSLIVGLAFIGIVVVAVLNALGNDESGFAGLGDEDAGRALPEFAVPDIRGPLDGDANFAQDDCETGENPCPPDSMRMPACRIDPEGAIRVCDLFDRPLAISFWFTRGGDCLPTQDAFDRAAERFGDEVNFLSINVRDDRPQAERIVADRGWSVPVGHDADGAVSNVYRVAVCPTLLFAYPGGVLQRGEVGRADEPITEPEITEMVDELIAASARRAAR